MSGYPIQTSAPKVFSELNLFDLYGLLRPEKSVFVLVNFLDVVFTYLLLESGLFYESNPVANFVLQGWGFSGMVALKFCVTLGVILIANYIAFQRKRTSRNLLMTGSAIIGAVVIYSSVLLAGTYMELPC